MFNFVNIIITFLFLVDDEQGKKHIIQLLFFLFLLFSNSYVGIFIQIIHNK